MLKRIVLLTALGLVAGSIWLAPAWWEPVWRVLNAGSIAAAAEYIRSFGAWAPVLSILLMILQSVIAPLPGSLVAATNGVVFGVGWGTALSWAGGMIGATINFWLARWLGHQIVARWFGHGRLQQLDQISARNGFWIVLVARLTPLVSFDFISYLAGLSSLTYRRFILATAVGMIPGTFTWTTLGHDILLAQTATWRLSLLALCAVIGLMAALWWRKRYAPQA